MLAAGHLLCKSHHSPGGEHSTANQSSATQGPHEQQKEKGCNNCAITGTRLPLCTSIFCGQRHKFGHEQSSRLSIDIHLAQGKRRDWRARFRSRILASQGLGYAGHLQSGPKSRYTSRSARKLGIRTVSLQRATPAIVIPFLTSSESTIRSPGFSVSANERRTINAPPTGGSES